MKNLFVSMMNVSVPRGVVLREESDASGVDTVRPVFVPVVDFADDSVSRERQLVCDTCVWKAVPDRVLLRAGVVDIGRRSCSGILVLQAPSTDRPLIGDATVTASLLGDLVPYDSHTMALKTTTPSILTIGLRNLARIDEFVIAGCADIVVTIAAFVAVEAAVFGRDCC